MPDFNIMLSEYLNYVYFVTEMLDFLIFVSYCHGKRMLDRVKYAPANKADIDDIATKIRCGF